MATIIRGPQIGERPRHVANGSANIPLVAREIPDSADERLQIEPAFDNGEALERANALVADAKAKLSALQDGIEQQRESAWNQGYEEGCLQAKEEGLDNYREQVSVVESLAKQLNGRVQQILDDAEDEVIELAFTAVGKILFGQFAQRDAVVRIVRKLKNQLSCENGQLVAHVSMNDFEQLNSRKNTEYELPDDIRLVADSRVKYGGCILETHAGNLDARMETQLQELLELFLHVRKQHHRDGM